MNSVYPFLLWLLRHKEWSSSCHAMSPAAECATTSRLNCLHISMSPWQMSQVGLGEVSYLPKYYTAVEVMYTTVWCLHVHHTSGRSTRFFPSKVPHCSSISSCENADKISGSSQSYSVQLAQSDSRATSIRARSTHCASYRDLHLWDDWSYKKCWQFSANLHMLLLLLLI